MAHTVSVFQTRTICRHWPKNMMFAKLFVKAAHRLISQKHQYGLIASFSNLAIWLHDIVCNAMSESCRQKQCRRWCWKQLTHMPDISPCRLQLLINNLGITKPHTGSNNRIILPETENLTNSISMAILQVYLYLVFGYSQIIQLWQTLLSRTHEYSSLGQVIWVYVILSRSKEDIVGFLRIFSRGAGVRSETKTRIRTRTIFPLASMVITKPIPLGLGSAGPV